MRAYHGKRMLHAGKEMLGSKKTPEGYTLEPRGLLAVVAVVAVTL